MRIKALAYSMVCLIGVSLPAAAAERIAATYNFILHGFVVSTAETVAALNPHDYRLDIDFRMRGIAKLFSNGHSEITATGRFGQGGGLAAERFVSAGHWDGSDYSRTMVFDGAGKLKEQKRDFPAKWLKEYRFEPVPKDMQVGPDPASLIVALLRDPPLAATGDGVKAYRVFDGDSVVEWQLKCGPDMVEVEKSSHSPKYGPARECLVGNRLVAGKLIETEKQRKKRLKREAKAAKRKDKDDDADVAPRLWLQAVPGSRYLVPIRAEFKTGMGTIRMYLKDLTYADTNGLSR
ncbi:DUF3108 domain-containing protein [Kordiimonas marina]|uniref:DUF3108 domain-containing protein n=1 Tax=Kordiimonas marina TaxID=2872312 RepID=UPI001FF17E20|nr:DUF3108 domain-containing protein [Kordiimonas marina]MCJ9429714.1 DUF3108 domain-containing protein [Kordiimonas marina]